VRFHKSIMVGLLCAFLFLYLSSVPPARAQLGDINGNELPAEIADLVYFLQYLYSDGPPPVVRNNADLDNCPGINLGDVLQLVSVLLVSSRGLVPPVGTDLVVPSGIKITTGWVIDAPGQIVTMEVKINTVDEPDLYGLVIPLSYQNLPGQVELRCDSVSFLGTLLQDAGAGYNIDEDNKKVLIYGYPYLWSDSLIIPSGSDGVMAKIDFEVLSLGTPTEIAPTYYPPEHTPLLISKMSYEPGDPPGRMLLPEFSRNYGPDVNCDGEVTLSDVVYTINYLLHGGPPPCGP